MNKETILQREIMLALSEAGCTVFRNNTGKAWHGRVILRDGNQVTLADAYMMPYGLAVGSADIVGIAPGGRFLSIEVKTSGGSLSDAQVTWLDAMRDAGAVAGVVRSPDDALRLINN